MSLQGDALIEQFERSGESAFVVAEYEEDRFSVLYNGVAADVDMETGEYEVEMNPEDTDAKSVHRDRLIAALEDIGLKWRGQGVYRHSF